MPLTSPEPFASYPHGGRVLLGRAGGDNARHGYGLHHQQLTGQCACGYCGMHLTDTYDHWLMLALDHVIPASVSTLATIPVEWADDHINRVLACSTCNTLDNRYRPSFAVACPDTLEAFIEIRDRVFCERVERIAKRHASERTFYEGKPWQK